MSDVIDTERVGFTCIWKIENFSMLPKLSNRTVICCPLFTADNLDETCWNLGVRPVGFSSENKDTFYFRLYKSPDSVNEAGFNIILDYELSILSKSGSKTKSVAVENYRFDADETLGTPLCITPREIFSKKEILPGDTLTVQCKMWYHKKQCLEPGFALARTRISAERKTFTWIIDKFTTLQANDKRSVSVNFPSYSNLSLTLTLYLKGTPSYDERILVRVDGINGEIFDYIVMLEISVQAINSKALYHFYDDFKVLGEKVEWHFPLFVETKQLYSNKDVLLPDDKLSLRCEFVISKYRYESFMVLNEIERTSYGVDAVDQLEATVSSEPRLRNQELPGLNSLKNDMRHIFDDKYLADISLRVRDEIFSVHKAVLVARSPVFKTMLDTDMKERSTNTIKIDDFEPDTIQRMLLYMYSDTFESDIHWEIASSLCLAADKYAVVGLKEKCSAFLKSHLNLTNVCEILILADILSDEDLKTSGLNFIEKRDKDVLNSNGWKDLAQTHSQLAVDILTSLYRNVKTFW